MTALFILLIVLHAYIYFLGDKMTFIYEKKHVTYCCYIRKELQTVIPAEFSSKFINPIAYLSSPALCLYLSLPFVLYFQDAIRKLHFSRQTGLNPGCCVIHVASLFKSCFTISDDKDSLHSSSSFQQ